MDKLIKKEVIKLYVSQIMLLLFSIFCSSVPLFSSSISFYGYKALAGLLIFAAVVVFEIIFIKTWFYRRNVILPAKYCLESLPGSMYEIDDNFNKGLFSEEETECCKERYRNTMDWLNKMVLFSTPFIIIDLLSLFLNVLVIVLKQLSLKKLYFSNMYGISAFFLLLQISTLYISCKFLFKSIKSWIERLHGIHETNANTIKN